VDPFGSVRIVGRQIDARTKSDGPRRGRGVQRNVVRVVLKHAGRLAGRIMTNHARARGHVIIKEGRGALVSIGEETTVWRRRNESCHAA
jgi:hypothetical protein